MEDKATSEKRRLTKASAQAWHGQRSHYVLATGEAGAERLRVVQSVHGPDTKRLLLRAGLSQGMKVADLGCGIGVISCWMAKQVGPTGAAYAIDISPEQIALARKESEHRNLQNIHFLVASAEATGLPRESFDLVYCRFLLMHLVRPLDALREMRDLLRPGGLLVCEEGDFASPFCQPPSAAFDRGFELYRALGTQHRADFCIGPKLYRLFLEIGMPSPKVALAQPVFVRGVAKRLPEWTLTECAPALLQAGLSTPEEIDRITAEMKTLAEDETTLIGMARMTQVWARKPEKGA